ncbi:fatty acid desaturase family protein [Actinokineospora spheciospongiae]|uniref:fatty acid desaturase family protein n=1 Tax=Actinokineospora spheciospongiae TaxID=909613 RepID=UPI000D8AC419|nr:hypothetical protein [Actinokineospora spheciospongiae]PWW66680.1 hypothetical protein DFQ13_101196 [Actinokineospora spheciospongiae]
MPARPATPYDPANPLYALGEEQLSGIAREFDALHDEVFGDLGEVDARYIRNMITFHRRLALLSRAVLLFSRYKPAWVLGTAGLGVAKVLENMEIGHNVMHGQWDWMNDPTIHSSTWDWDTASPAAAWKHSHNYVHHTYTDVIGKDNDVGYEIMRIDARQPWKPAYLLQPFYNLLLTAFFEWGVAVHDLDFEKIRTGRKPKKQVWDEIKAIGVKARRQVVKDYLVYAVRAAVQHRAAAQAVGFGAAHDPAAGVPRRSPAAQARPVRGAGRGQGGEAAAARGGARVPVNPARCPATSGGDHRLPRPSGPSRRWERDGPALPVVRVPVNGEPVAAAGPPGAGLGRTAPSGKRCVMRSTIMCSFGVAVRFAVVAFAAGVLVGSAAGTDVPDRAHACVSDSSPRCPGSPTPDVWTS